MPFFAFLFRNPGKVGKHYKVLKYHSYHLQLKKMFLEEIINLSIALTSKINIGLFDQIPSFVFWNSGWSCTSFMCDAIRNKKISKINFCEINLKTFISPRITSCYSKIYENINNIQLWFLHEPRQILVRRSVL